jgi:aminoglycoside 3-N-acetyltransferase
VCSFAAIGRLAGWVVGGQSLDEGYGAGSPLERLVEADGAVLLLGDLFENVTLLHHAEYAAAVPVKRYVEYEMPVFIDGRRVWRRTRELDSSAGALPYDELGLDDDEFAVIVRSALAGGLGQSGRVGRATAHLLPARPLFDHARAWMERSFT